MAVIIVMILVAAVTLVDIVTLVAVMAVVESHCDDRIVRILLCRFHYVDFIV